MLKLSAKALAAGAALALVGGGFLAQPSSAAPGGGACQLHGQANFHPGPGIDQNANWAYDFGGTLSNCQSNLNALSGGTISAGQKYTDSTGTYQEPTSTGTGSCGTGTTQGTAFVQWAGGGVTVITYTTTSGAAGVVLQGNVANDGVVSGHKVITTVYPGAGVAGLLAFEVNDPSQCVASTGVVAAGIDGVTGIGSPS